MDSKEDFKQKLLLNFKKDFTKTKSLKNITKLCAKNKQTVSRKKIIILVIIGILIPVVGIALGEDVWELLPFSSECLLEQNEISMEITRPLFNCDVCRNLDSFPIVSDLSAEEFERNYAFTGVPVVVTKAARNWTALNSFSVQFFRDLYHSDSKFIEKANEDCQFFPYFTAWDNLGEALNMTKEEEEAMEEGKKWYIGWNNCVPEIETILRQHYNKPHFLPTSGGYVRMDWIFMGGSGPGAPSHIDSVGRPSWQAQIRGQKTWFLEPPAECDHVCRPISVMMNASDIIALDTDRWYHSTYVHPGDISITIGSEYD